MDIKKSLYTYMINTPGEFVGFFSVVSDLLNDLGNEWMLHAKTNKDDIAKSWGNVLLMAAETTKGISEALDKIRIEHEKRTTENQLESFKNKVIEIKGSAL